MHFIEPEYQRALESTETQIAATGFQSPAHDYIVRKLDLNQLLMRSPYATFFVWVDQSDIEGIEKGDLVVINKSLTPKDGRIALVYSDGNFCLRRLERQKGLWFFLTDKNSFREPANSEDICWGIVDAIIRCCWS